MNVRRPTHRRRLALITFSPAATLKVVSYDDGIPYVSLNVGDCPSESSEAVEDGEILTNDAVKSSTTEVPSA